DYDEIRRVLAEARSHPPLKRRSEEQSVPAHSSKDPSSRGASAASPHDSPPPGPRSPPPPGTIIRRRTVRSEATRNDLLWTKATPENLREFAAKGDMAGVANILNVGQKADTESLIAAAKGGHDDVMQLLLGIGYADPDPLPLSGNHRDGYNTPMLATIGRGNLAVIRLLLDQPRFNPTRRFFKERTYYELSRERKGVQWEEEADLLKEAYDRFARARKMRKPETKSPRRSRDKERERERDREREREKEVKRPVGRGSVSPPSQRKTVRSPTSSRHHEPLPKDTAPSRGKVREESSAHQRERLTQTAPRARVSNRDDHHSEPSVAASDVDLGRFELPHRKPKVFPGRRQSDSGAAARGEDQVRRRRLIAGRPPHDRDQRRPSLLSSDSLSGREEMSRARADRGSWDTQMVKQHPVAAPSSLKRSRSSLTPNRSRSRDRKPRREPEDLKKKKRRVLSEDHAQNITTGSAKKGHEPAVERPRARPRDHSVPDPGRVKSHQAATGVEKEQPARTRKPAEEPRVDVIVKEERRKNDGPRLDDIPMTAVDSREIVDHVANKKSEAEAMAVAAAAAAAQAQAEAVAAAAAAEVRRLAEEEAKKAEEDRIAEEKRAAAAAAEQARIAKEEKEREAKEAAEEAARLAREKAEEEERKRREAERRRRIRLLREQEEQERRRRNALPNRLRVAANLVGSNDPRARSLAWLKKFMPVVTAKTKQIDPACEPDLTDERWVPNYLVAPLLATNDLQLTQYPSWEKRNATPTQRNNLWRVTRRILVQADDSDFFGSSMGQVMQKDCETRPKYFDMEHVFWVRLSDFLDLVPHIPHLNGLEIDLLNMHIDGEPVIDHPIPESPQVNGHAFGFHHEESSTVMNGLVNGFGHVRLSTYV
ncbi:hypothetical protein Egran_05281, partial [Elaphomyces granulatus]